MTDLRVDDFKSPDKPYQEDQMDTREPPQPVPMPWTGVTEGRIVHVTGRPRGGGHCQAAIVVRRFAGSTGAVNVLVFPDGSNDGVALVGGYVALEWETSVHHESEGSFGPAWHWPERA